MNAGATLANLAWLASSLPAHRRFARALHEPSAAQSRWLRGHLARNGDTAYGRAWHCRSIGNYAEFARRLPLTTYEDYRPRIERIQRGERGVLVREPVIRLVPTSGSTGARKLIPFTATLQREFNAAVGPWMIDLALRAPSIIGGPSYWAVTPMGEAALRKDADSLIPIGFEDDANYLGGARAWLVAKAMAVPAATRHLGDLERFRHTVLLHLLHATDLRLISVWHPSFLSLLLDTLVQDWKTLLAELTRHDSRRAAALSGADPTAPATIWPRLRVVSCWADAHARSPADHLQRRLPGVILQPKGLLASEGCITLPFAGQHPVACCSHLFEFIDEAGVVHPVDDLRVGNTYEIVITTGGGLWRYRLGDRVQVTGFVARTPSLRFLDRAGNVSDRCGEKLSEAFVTQVLARICPEAPFALLAPECDDDVWRYALFVEGPTGAGLQSSLDTALAENPHYALCRRLGQLAPPRVVPLAENAYARFTAAEVSRGMRLGDIKPAALSQRTDWAEDLEREGRHDQLAQTSNRFTGARRDR